MTQSSQIIENPFFTYIQEIFGLALTEFSCLLWKAKAPMVTMYFALLALGSLVAVFAVLVSSLVSVPMRNTWRDLIGPHALPLAIVVAVVTTGGSLYLSEVLGYQPCRLCWYQRAAAYPLAFMLPVALLVKRPNIHRVAAPMAIVGALISCYHLLIEHFPSLESSTCDPNNPCSLIWVRHFGFVTIPFMALASFLLHLVLVVLGEQNRKAAT